MQITSAEFIMSNSDVKKCPSSALPEYAFIGRSNVGKSSLINMLVNRKNLAKTSGKPGKTQLLNHFLKRKNRNLVISPDNAIANVTKQTKKKFKRFTPDFFNLGKDLVPVLVLMTSSVKPWRMT